MFTVTVNEFSYLGLGGTTDVITQSSVNEHSASVNTKSRTQIKLYEYDLQLNYS